ncbi:hypothetical protein Tco_1574095, partial [Tanacetum coccineum]
MGGVCTGGTLKREEYGGDGRSSVGFSGKLKSVTSFGGQKKVNNKKDDDYDDGLSSSYGGGYDDEAYHRRMTSYDSGELFFSISRELKPSTPARVTK